jgi:uncharacterized membrane protein YqhA
MKRIIESSRYAMLIAVITLIITSFAALLWSAGKAIKVIANIAETLGDDPAISLYLIQLMDGFLIAIALYVFAVSIYELFIGGLTLPEWMIAHNLYELKGKLSSIVILVIAVKFLEKFLEAKDPQAILYSGLGATAVIAGLIAFGYFGKKD